MLGDELGRMDAAAFEVAGVTLSAPQARFAWQAWHFEHFRVDLRDRHGTFRTFKMSAEARRRTGSDGRHSF